MGKSSGDGGSRRKKWHRHNPMTSSSAVTLGRFVERSSKDKKKGGVEFQEWLERQRDKRERRSGDGKK